MKTAHSILCSLLFAAASLSVAAQAPLDKLLEGTFRPAPAPSIVGSIDGEHYYRANKEQNAILRYRYSTGKLVDTIFYAPKARECKFKQFDGYFFSPDEKSLILFTDSEPIYRRSFKANYHLYERSRNLTAPLAEEGKQMCPIFSPNGRQIAYVRNNNIYLVQMDFNYAQRQITKDGEANKILNGVVDWVYEEELGLTSLYSFSGDNEHILFIHTNESEVSNFGMNRFKGITPSFEKNKLYPEWITFKYPKAGEPNAKIELRTYNIASKITRTVDLGLQPDSYIVRLKPTADPLQHAAILLNRNQNDLEIRLCNPKAANSTSAYREQTTTYFDNIVYDQLSFVGDGFYILSDRSGYRHLYKYGIRGNLITQLTKGNWEITKFHGYDATSRRFFYESTEQSPLMRTLFSVDNKGKKSTLTPKAGTNRVTFNPTFTYYLLNYSSIVAPPVYSLQQTEGKTSVTIEDNQAYLDQVKTMNLPRRQLFTVRTSDGTILNGWMLLPPNAEEKKSPLLMVQYNGPGSQIVLDRWMLDFEEYFAAKGFVVAAVDGRGTGGRGVEFQKSNYPTLGIIEAKDQIEAAHFLAKHPSVDPTRIAINGWSFGGYNVLMALSMPNTPFKAGVAIAPVTDWRFYNTIYTERYLKTPQQNGDGYDKSSPLHYADQLQGNLLLIHGLMDDNVHYQNVAEYTEALVQAGKQFEMQVYTNRDHTLRGGKTRHHLYTRMYNYLLRAM